MRSQVVFVITCGTTVTGSPRRVAASTSTTLGNSAIVAIPFRFGAASMTSVVDRACRRASRCSRTPLTPASSVVPTDHPLRLEHLDVGDLLERGAPDVHHRLDDEDLRSVFARLLRRLAHPAPRRTSDARRPPNTLAAVPRSRACTLVRRRARPSSPAGRPGRRTSSGPASRCRRRPDRPPPRRAGIAGSAACRRPCRREAAHVRARRSCERPRSPAQTSHPLSSRSRAYGHVRRRHEHRQIVSSGYRSSTPP